MKKIILALAFLSYFMFAEEVKELTDEQINTLVKVCESGKDFTNENGTVKYEEACATLGMIYENIPVLGDLGVKQDLAKAFKFYKKACDGNDYEACSNLGTLYSEGQGEGVKQDSKKAIKLYTKACDGGYAAGCSNLGVMYSRGQGVEKDFVKAAARARTIRDFFNILNSVWVPKEARIITARA